MANSHFIEQWVFDRITELKGSINPNTGKKYTRRQIVDKIRGEGGKVSFDTVARKGPTTAKKSRTEYAKLHPDLKSKLLSRNETTAQKAVDLARHREWVKNNPEKVKAGDKRYRESPKGKTKRQSLEKHRDKAKVVAKTGRRRARLREAATELSQLPAFKTEIDEIYRLSSLFPDQFDVDHIKRLVDGGLHEPDNLRLLSKELHNLKKALENSGRFGDAARVGAFNEYNLAPNVRGVLAENVLEEKWGKKGLMNFLGDAYQNVKPGLKFAGKTLLRAAPFAGASLGVKAADDYRRSGQNKLAAAAAMSAIPGPIGWLGLGAEMGGLLWNKVTEDPNFLHRGILDDDQKRWTYTGRGRKRG